MINFFEKIFSSLRNLSWMIYEVLEDIEKELMKSYKFEVSGQKVLTHVLEVSTHKDKRQTRIEVSTHRVEQLTHVDNEQSEFKVSTHEDNVQRIEGVDT